MASSSPSVPGRGTTVYGAKGCVVWATGAGTFYKEVFVDRPAAARSF
ncbi:86c3790e-da2f-4dbb-8cc9-789682a0530b [Thermothielavioides terrestris]|uniref:86c3790e-da2f-4dbb-8cc9-789682a0530b n=1 Tax=Thermothielavioides terrestris TaxID=2587410 RepID=A0A446BSQ8_9PEZI|nr:86c3790e-da2f-4dbb-8cc9-789682a0530b [Thermothielavioides terrestris]